MLRLQRARSFQWVLMHLCGGNWIKSPDLFWTTCGWEDCMHFLENDFHIKGIERVGAMVGENDFEGTPPPTLASSHSFSDLLNKTVHSIMTCFVFDGYMICDNHINVRSNFLLRRKLFPPPHHPPVPTDWHNLTTRLEISGKKNISQPGWLLDFMKSRAGHARFEPSGYLDGFWAL